MPHRRRRNRIGLPEAGLVLAFIVAVAPLSFWWISLNQPDWKKTSGLVISGTIEHTHYNAEPYASKVHVKYRYIVGATSYTGEISGLWPEVGGPNALTQDRLDELTKGGHTLVIYYDPENPSHSTPLPALEESQLGYALSAIGGLLAGGAYLFVVYPRIRRR